MVITARKAALVEVLAVKHKRGRLKNARSGCLMCKWWKQNDTKHSTKALPHSDAVALQAFRQTES